MAKRAKAKVEVVIPPLPMPKPRRVKGKGVEPAAVPASEAEYPPEKTAKGFARAEMMMPTSPSALLNNLIAREISDPSGPVEPISDTVNTLVKLTHAMSSGEDISDIKDSVIRISTNQPEKMEVHQSVINLINQERVTDAIVVRAKVEKVLKRAVERGDLSTGECLAIWEMSNNTIREFEATSAKRNKPVDTITVVNKVDFRTAESIREAQREWEGTTPQGRQVMRMKLFDLKRQVMAAQAQAAAPEPGAESAEDPGIKAVIDV